MAQDTETYPHLRKLLVAFLEGALQTLLRFCGEFAEDGMIAKSTVEQQELAHMETTNNANEGALGTLRTTLRRAPRMSLSQFNARLQYKKNRTGTYMKKFLGRCQCKAQVEYDRKLVERNYEMDKWKKERRDVATAKLDAVVPCVVDADLARLRVSDIALQLRWHRQFDTKVPRNKDMPKKKDEKLRVLREAVVRYTRGELKEDVPQKMQEAHLGAGESEDKDDF
ncbi:hypothetical protein M405DRAFT_869578 [Rhizopogon salebrosus TDB-379]|nr:hypothetical protein M405DRAFT_869578 [Rhizopogon salebrosus TDB-379]